MRNIRYKRAISALVLLALMSLACNLFNRISSTPVQSTSIPISTEAVDSLREDISTAVDDFGKGEQVTLVIDEAELSSLVAFELQKQSEPIFHEPQIYLQDGQVQVSGKVQQGGFLVPLILAGSATPGVLLLATRSNVPCRALSRGMEPKTRLALR